MIPPQGEFCAAPTSSKSSSFFCRFYDAAFGQAEGMRFALLAIVNELDTRGKSRDHTGL